MTEQAPHIVGIAGGSCAGKTWLATSLLERLRTVGINTVRLSLDDFYRDRSELTAARRARLNFDHPRAIDWGSFETVLAGFASGSPVHVPSYDFATHSRRSVWGTLASAPVVIVEGLWLFRRPLVRRHFNYKIYIRGTSSLCEERRLRRDIDERGRHPHQVIEQWQRHTLPMFNKFVAPQERWADLVIEAPITTEQVNSVADRIASHVGINNQLTVGI